VGEPLAPFGCLPRASSLAHALRGRDRDLVRLTNKLKHCPCGSNIPARHSSDVPGQRWRDAWPRTSASQILRCWRLRLRISTAMPN